jgi:hypothetical protein
MAKRVSKKSLTPQQIKNLLNPVLTGPDRVFQSDADRRKAWIEYKDQVMAVKRNPCTRPAAWWDYEFSGKRWFGESQRQALARMDLLTESEIAFLKDAGQCPVKPCPGPDWDPRDILKE